MITVTKKGDFSRLDTYLNRLKGLFGLSDLDKYGKRGVEALSSATPRDSGTTAASWFYRINKTDGELSLEFYNSNINEGVPIAVILQYGHGTGTGGWVEGRDYINPALRSVFDGILDDMTKELRGI
jgi:hypothetical protein